jgi:hypothetical protein
MTDEGESPAGQGGASQPTASPSTNSNNSPGQPTDQGNQDPLRRPITPPVRDPKIADIFQVYLKKNCKLNFGMAVGYLHRAVDERYETFLQSDLKRVEMTGERRQGVDSPRDIASFILDYESPKALLRHNPKINPREKRQRQKRTPYIKELRYLSIALGGRAYLALIGAYAHLRGDLEGTRKVWDIFTNEYSPYWTMLQPARRRSSWVNAVRHRVIYARARKLKEQHPGRSLAIVLAGEFNLSPGRIRSILAKEEIFTQVYSRQATLFQKFR